MIRVLSRACFRGLYWLGIGVFASFAVSVLVLRYWLLPKVPEYRADIEAAIESRLNADVSIGSIQSAWRGLRPVIRLGEFSINDQDGKPALSLGQVDIALSWWTLASGQPQLHEVTLIKPVLALRRERDGKVYLGDRALGGKKEEAGSTAFVDWLLEQPHLVVSDAGLTWHDKLMNAPEVRLTGVGMELDRTGSRHRLALVGAPSSAGVASVDVRADLAIARDAAALLISGEVFAQLGDLDIARLKQHLPYAGPQVESMFASGRGALRTWLTLSKNQLESATVDVAARDLKVKLSGDVKPLELTNLQGRVSYSARTDGFTVAAQSLAFSTREGLKTQAANFSLAMGYAMPIAVSAEGAGKPNRADFSADGIDLAVASALVEYFPVPADLKQRITQLQPRGQLRNAKIHWQKLGVERATELVTEGRVENFGINSVDQSPAVTGLTADWRGNDDAGEIKIASNKLVFQAPYIMGGPLAFDAATAQARWSRVPVSGQPPTAARRALRVDVSGAKLTNADLELEFGGAFQSLPESKERSPGWVDLKGKITRADASRVHAYLPNGIAQTRAWLDRALTAGRIDMGDFVVKGDLWHFPFTDGKHGEFKVDARLAGARLKFSPDWPAIEDLKAKLEFRNAGINVVADSARMFDTRFDKLNANILLSGSYTLNIEGDAKPSAVDSYRILRESPLKDGAGKFTDVVALDGPGELTLKLAIPFGDSTAERFRMQGRYRLVNNDARISPQLRLAGATGDILFGEDGLRPSAISGRMFGETARLVLTPTTDGVRAELEGRVASNQLAFLLAPTLLNPLSGSVVWKADFNATSKGTALRIESNLAGLKSDFPAPLGKRATESMPLQVDIANFGTPDETLRVKVAERVNIWLFRDFAKEVPEVRSAVVQLGATGSRPEAPKDTGLWITGSLPFVDYDEWRRVTQAAPAASAASVPAPAPDSGLDLKGVDIAVGRLKFFGQEYAAVTARLSRTGSVWSGRLASPDIEGSVSWDGIAAGGKGSLTARLSRFHIFAGTPNTAAVATQGGPPKPAGAASATPENSVESGDLPALDIKAESFRFKQQWLGELELKAAPAGEEWRIDRVAFTTGHAKVEAVGGWRRTGNGSITRLNLVSEANNLNALFAQFGHGEALKRGTGSLKGQLSWPGYPYDFALNQLFGDFRMEWKDGQFAKLEPGLGKLLGLISLQSVPRRFTLDFRDVFSEGFAFDRITGDVKIARGVMLTDNFEVAGPAAFISMQGEVSLPNETQTLKVRVVPEVGEGVAIAATILGTPVIGLTTLLVQKLLQNPLNRIVAYEYAVTGTWDNPVVARPNQQAAVTPAAPKP